MVPYFPHGRDFSLDLPHLSGNSSQALYIYVNFGAFENPPTPQKFPILSVGGVWIFSGTTLSIQLKTLFDTINTIYTGNIYHINMHVTADL